jgi:hypothetical protein
MMRHDEGFRSGGKNSYIERDSAELEECRASAALSLPNEPVNFIPKKPPIAHLL